MGTPIAACNGTTAGVPTPDVTNNSAEWVTKNPTDGSEVLPAAVGGAALPESGPRPFSLHASLVSLVALCVLPLALSALLLVWMQYRHGSEQVREATLLEARRRAAALDREFASLMAGMKVLATAPELAHDDLAAWHQRASAAAPTQNVDNFVLTDREGRQRVNTLRAYGDPLPTTGTPAQLAPVFSSGTTVVTDLFTGPVTRRPVMAIGVPVIVAGSVRYSLNIGVAPGRFQGLLEARELPSGWLAAMLDGEGTVVARTRVPANRRLSSVALQRPASWRRSPRGAKAARRR